MDLNQLSERVNDILSSTILQLRVTWLEDTMVVVSARPQGAISSVHRIGAWVHVAS